MRSNNWLIFTLVIFIIVFFSLAVYYQSKANYFRQELELQQIKYEILIKEPRVRNIIESGG